MPRVLHSRATLILVFMYTYTQTAIRNYVLYGQTTSTSDDRIVTVGNYPNLFLSPYLTIRDTGLPIAEALPDEGQ